MSRIQLVEILRSTSNRFFTYVGSFFSSHQQSQEIFELSSNNNTNFGSAAEIYELRDNILKEKNSHNTSVRNRCERVSIIETLKTNETLANELECACYLVGDGHYQQQDIPAAKFCNSLIHTDASKPLFSPPLDGGPFAGFALLTFFCCYRRRNRQVQAQNDEIQLEGHAEEVVEEGKAHDRIPSPI